MPVETLLPQTNTEKDHVQGKDNLQSKTIIARITAVSSEGSSWFPLVFDFDIARAHKEKARSSGGGSCGPTANVGGNASRLSGKAKSATKTIPDTKKLNAARGPNIWFVDLRSRCNLVFCVGNIFGSLLIFFSFLSLFAFCFIRIALYIFVFTYIVIQVFPHFQPHERLWTARRAAAAVIVAVPAPAVVWKTAAVTAMHLQQETFSSYESGWSGLRWRRICWPGTGRAK